MRLRLPCRGLTHSTMDVFQTAVLTLDIVVTSSLLRYVTDSRPSIHPMSGTSGSPAPGNSRAKTQFSALSNSAMEAHLPNTLPHLSPSPAQPAMVLKIRLARFGKRNAPFYNIVVAQARYVTLPPSPLDPPTPQKPSPSPSLLTRPFRTARDSKPLEVLGTYDPIPKAPLYGDGKPFKDIKLDTSRAKYWLGVGAQPSEPAWRLLSMVGLAFVLVLVLGWGMG